MTQINSPFLLPKLRPISELSKQENNYHEQIERILQQIYRRIGGAIDSTDDGLEEASDNETQIALILGMLSILAERLDAVELEDPLVNVPRRFNHVVATSPYIAADFDHIEARSRAVVTLPAKPSVESVIIVRNGDGTMITIEGNGKTINGSRVARIYKEGTSLTLTYFVTSDKWVVK